jgi:hypothetical protein
MLRTDPSPSRTQLWVLNLVGGLLVLGVTFHLGVTFLSNSPENVLKTRYQGLINGYLSPELEQHWAMFAPGLPMHDTTLFARVSLRMPDGREGTTRWTDVTAADLEALRYDPVPTRVRMQLRAGWSDVLSTHDSEGRTTSSAGVAAARLLTRLALPRVLPSAPEGTTVIGIQFRSVTAPVQPPPWQPSDRTEPTTRDLAWWDVAAEDAELVAEVAG